MDAFGFDGPALDGSCIEEAPWPIFGRPLSFVFGRLGLRESKPSPLFRGNVGLGSPGFDGLGRGPKREAARGQTSFCRRRRNLRLVVFERPVDDHGALCLDFGDGILLGPVATELFVWLERLYRLSGHGTALPT